VEVFARQRSSDDRPGTCRPRASAGKKRDEDAGTAGPGAWIERVEHGWFERQRDSRTVTRFTISPERPTMPEGAQAGEREGQHPVEVPATGIRYEPDPACIVLETGVVEGSDRWTWGWRHALLR
jgi:hypothetical protein